MTNDPSRTNESWIIEAGGDIIEKHAKCGLTDMSPLEQLIYWLWWADYMMRNAGDFANAVADDKDFQVDASSKARQLNLAYTAETFSLPRPELQARYFERFDRVCDEIRSFIANRN